MNTTLKFDRVVLTKELNEKFKQVGEVFEIAQIFDDSFLLRDSKTRVALGVVNFQDFENHFVNEENFKGWTPWTEFATDYEANLKMFYRTKDRRKVQVKTSNGCVGESCCNSKFGDEFNLYLGLNLAYLRCIKNILVNKIDNYTKNIHSCTSEIIDVEHQIKQIVNKI